MGQYLWHLGIRDNLAHLAARKAAGYLFQGLYARGLTLCTAESLTAGLFGAYITSFSGASSVYWGGLIVYSPEAKIRLCGVDPQTIALKGVVSGETAAQMALGALERSGADMAISLTGVAGPSGGSAETPVGTVWIACAHRLVTPSRSPTVVTLALSLKGGRERVRMESVRQACLLARSQLDR